MPAKPGGRVLIFYGGGKGKSTAALGAALRAVGHGLKVLVVQFIKCRECGEHLAAKRLEGLLEIRPSGTGFLREEDAAAMKEATAKAHQALRDAAEALAAGEHGLVILDEVLPAIRHGLLETDAVRAAVQARAPGVHVILTGDGPNEAFADMADTITKMQFIKHPYKPGQPPTRGIEF